MQLASELFETYNRNLRRIMWAELRDEQLRAARASQFRASLVDNPYVEQTSLAMLYDHVRNERRN